MLGTHAAVPLGNAASVAYVDLATETVDRYFTFASGNATGSAFVNANTVVVCNQTTDQCGKFDPAQAANEVTGAGDGDAVPHQCRGDAAGGCSWSRATWTTATWWRARAW